MKAVILAAGKGKRMQPLTFERPKPMILVSGRPLLYWVIKSLPEEISELVLIIGYKGDQIKDYFGESFNGKTINYIWQNEPLGTGHALHLSKDLIKDGEKFLFIFADDLHSSSAIKRMVTRNDLCVLVKKHNEPKSFGVVQIDANGNVLDIEEKPENPKSDFVAVGVYIFDSRFFNYQIRLSSRGEYEYVDALKSMVKDTPVAVEESDFWYPISNPSHVEGAERIINSLKEN